MTQIQVELKAAPSIKPMVNVGAGFDVPTGHFLVGKYGEYILNGGMAFMTGVVGQGNVFKSSIADWMQLTAMARMCATATIYDTEISKHEFRLKQVVFGIREFYGEDVIENGRLILTDKTIYTGDEYYDITKEFMLTKIKNREKNEIELPFMNRDRSAYMRIIAPTFCSIDSFSEFSTKDVIKMQDDNSLGEAGGNTIPMRQGLQKTRFLMEVPGLAGGSYTWFILTGQIGDEFVMDPRKPPEKKLTDMKQGKKFKGVPEKFTFVMNNCWYGLHVERLINDNTKSVEYPRDSDDNLKGDTDLNVVTFKQLRGKSGPTGMPVRLVISQEDGVQPSLSEFHNIKEMDRYGLGGNIQNYYLELCPEIKLSRTTVRGKIERHPDLQRALNITNEMCQINIRWRNLDERLQLSPKELYEKIKELGYDWNMILTQTRGWWAPVGLHENLKFLSTMDLLRMANGLYIPYWMENPPEKAVQLYNQTHKNPWVFGVPQLETYEIPGTTTSV